ncbi:AAA family ATPase [Mycoplasma sp. Pen4]|uniref:DnaB-like helicase C-terminal domain-containing protein n=1 Tax=Mycoplasma sp. Pen4 TaxID=640330 RepID=UPI001654007E|nr:DnaB-like helicase C-terminal domain-containing protein [Mycoplasma sp. Pen4]QNM93556.1 AAA family ATPase [Mycoplasma sp. Pen4]
MSKNKRNNFKYNPLYKNVSEDLVPLATTLFKDEQIELETLSNILNDTEKQSLGFDYLTPEAFFTNECKQLFTLLKTTRDKSDNKTITFDYNDITRLVDDVVKLDLFEYNALNSFVLNKIFSVMFNEDNFIINVEKLIELQKMRNIESFYNSYTKALSTNKEITWSDSIDDMQNFILYNNKMSIKNSEFIPLTDAAVNLRNHINEILLNKKTDDKTLLTGFETIDNYVKGFKPGQMIILAARPGVGKTALALNIAKNVIDEGAKNGTPKNVAFISLEMPTNELTSRYLATASSVDLYKIQNPKLITSQDDAMKLFTTIEKINGDSLIWFDDEPKSKITEIVFKIKHLMKSLNGNLDLVVIDYLQLISGSDAGGNRQNEVATISRSLKTLALELKVPILALSQLSRSVENREDKRPQLHDLRESGSIEQDADIVLMLNRKPFKNKNSQEQEDITKYEHIPVIVSVAKNRGGQQGYGTLIYTGKYVKFTDEKVKGEY